MGGRSGIGRSLSSARLGNRVLRACEIAIVLRPTPHVTGSVWCGLEPLFRQIVDSLSDDSIGTSLGTFPVNRVLAHPDLSDQERLNRFLRLSKWGVGPYREHVHMLPLARRRRLERALDRFFSEAKTLQSR